MSGDEARPRCRCSASSGFNAQGMDPARCPVHGDHRCHGVGHCEVCGAEEPPPWPVTRP